MQWLHIIAYNSSLTHSSGQYWYKYKVLFCTVATSWKTKPRPHDGTATIDLDKNRLVEIPLSRSEPPDDGLTRIQ